MKSKRSHYCINKGQTITSLYPPDKISKLRFSFKKQIPFFVLLFFGVFGFNLLTAQNPFLQRIDSVDHLLSELKTDEARKVLDNLATDKAAEIETNSLKLQMYYAYLNFRIKNFSTSLEHYMKAKNIAINLKDSSSLAKIYFDMSIIYKYVSSDKNRKDFFKKAETIATLINDTAILIGVLTNNGAKFDSENNPDSAIFYYEKSTRLALTNEKKYIGSIITNDFNIGLVYENTNKARAIYQFKKLIDKCLLHNRKIPLSNGYSTLANLYYNVNRKDSALYFANRSLVISKQISDYGIDIQVYGLLAKIYEEKSNFREALKNLYLRNKAQEIVTERMLADKANALIHLRNIELKDIEIKKLQEQKQSIEQRNRLRYFLGTAIALLLFLILIIVVLVHRFQKKKMRLLSIALNERTLKLEQEKIMMQQTAHLKEYEARLQGQDMAREHIARELHDQIANSLAALKLKVTKVNKIDANTKGLNQIIEVLDIIYHQVRSLAHTLHIPDFDKRPLTTLVLEFISDFEKVTNVSVSWSAFPEDEVNRLPGSIKKTMFLIIQELFTNAAKYAKASLINLTLNKHEDEFILIMEDNGYGFETNSYSGIGLTNIEWRINKLNGFMELQTKPYIGTCINIRIPTNTNAIC